MSRGDHAPLYWLRIGPADPGPSETGVLWIDTSGGPGLWRIYARNATNDGWELLGGSAAGAPPETFVTDALGNTLFTTSGIEIIARAS